MDRRTWFQLIGILSLARPAYSQQRPVGDGRGQQPQQPMRVTKDQVAAALKLLGLEFQDSEMESMLRGVNQALGNYESLRKLDIRSILSRRSASTPGFPAGNPSKGRS